MNKRRLICSVSPFLRSETGQQELARSHPEPLEGLGSRRIQLIKTKQKTPIIFTVKLLHQIAFHLNNISRLLHITS